MSEEIQLETPAEKVARLEEDLCIVGISSSTGIVLVTVETEDGVVEVRVETPKLRHRILDALIDGLGNKLDEARREAANA
ncbi:hypothetical protein [Hymenobacter wooponensis]|uniref:Uncharacterized protein n=1 Tax=Hymenobacter wooponensis TaxID=1525360 RepID=A0A4Z0MTR3_9BACT|nr:hypothetical protein [Hymenobacter wooponensis]TGD82859.1 hypothetical protein EU557_03505 [Hymenobacter wooponensis]